MGVLAGLTIAVLVVAGGPAQPSAGRRRRRRFLDDADAPLAARVRSVLALDDDYAEARHGHKSHNR